MKMFDRTMAVICAVLALMLFTRDADAADVAWDASADYCSTVNPCRAWSYGWQYNDGQFNLLEISNTDKCLIPGMTCWVRSNSIMILPKIGLNTTGMPIEFRWLQEYAVIPVNAIHMQPDLEGRQPVLQFTVPKDGRHVLQGSAQLVHNMAQTAGLLIYVNDHRIRTKLLSGYGNVQNFKIDKTFKAGDTVRFAVDPNGSPSYDYVELRVSAMRTD